MKILKLNENIYNGVDAIVKDGIVLLEGTKTHALNQAYKIKEYLKPYKNINPVVAYQNVESYGYFYYIIDLEKYSFDKATKLISKFDKLLMN